MVMNGEAGVGFAVWAPNAKEVSVVGDFNHWDETKHRMYQHRSVGVWELFIPGLAAGTIVQIPHPRRRRLFAAG